MEAILIDYLIIKGPVTIPDEIDLTNDRALTAQEIQQAAYEFLQNYGIIDAQHSFRKIGVVVESYIAAEETEFNNETYPPGTWFITVRVIDREIILAIQNGELTGFSIGALPSKGYDELKRDLPVTKGMFNDVDEGKWFPLAVSIVDKPAMEKAMFKVFSEDEFIKKSFREDTMNKEEVHDSPAVVAIKGLIDLIKKEEPEDEGLVEKEEKPESEYATKKDLEDFMVKVKAMIKEEKEPEAEPEIEPKEEPVPDNINKSEDVTEEVEEPEPDEEEQESEVISKSLPVDKPVTKKESFNKQIGRDSFGRKI